MISISCFPPITKLYKGHSYSYAEKKVAIIIIESLHRKCKKIEEHLQKSFIAAIYFIKCAIRREYCKQ